MRFFLLLLFPSKWFVATCFDISRKSPFLATIVAGFGAAFFGFFLGSVVGNVPGNGAVGPIVNLMNGVTIYLWLTNYVFLIVGVVMLGLGAAYSLINNDFSREVNVFTRFHRWNLRTMKIGNRS